MMNCEYWRSRFILLVLNNLNLSVVFLYAPCKLLMWERDHTGLFQIVFFLSLDYHCTVAVQIDRQLLSAVLMEPRGQTRGLRH